MYEHQVQQTGQQRTGDQEQESLRYRTTDYARSTEEPLPAPAAASVGGTLFREIIQVLLPALVMALAIHLFLAQATIVYGRSMEPSLYERQRLIIDKFTYYFRAPVRNDIVVIKRPDMDELLVKRIVGLPTEKVEIRDGYVYINDQPLPEPFPHDQYPQNLPPHTLGPVQYFVLGDNRGNSNDSRSFGPILREDIIGRVWFRYWPLSQFHSF
ncbi:MAG: signal peptidase I [Caldilineaceae bacterium]|nr:signal peptidase I [Caldilineaceae bacterium]